MRAQANHMITQEFEFVAEGDKLGRLVRLLEREMDGSRLLVFCETKRGCDAVTRQLRQNGWPALSIHGDKSQEERDWVLSVRPTSKPFLGSPCASCARTAGPRSPSTATRARRSATGCSACAPLATLSRDPVRVSGCEACLEALSIHRDKSQEERDWVLSVRPTSESRPGTLLGCLGVKPVWKRSPFTATRARRSATGCSACAPSPSPVQGPCWGIWV